MVILNTFAPPWVFDSLCNPTIREWWDSLSPPQRAAYEAEIERLNALLDKEYRCLALSSRTLPTQQSDAPVSVRQAAGLTTGPAASPAQHSGKSSLPSTPSTTSDHTNAQANASPQPSSVYSLLTNK